MADSKISALTALAEAPASGDLLVLVDVSDTTMAASGTDKKITYTNLTSALVSGATTFATSSAQTFTNGIVSSAMTTINSAVSIATAPNLLCVDTTAVAAGVGGGIQFRGNFSGTTPTQACAIRASKSSAVDGEYGFDLLFYSRRNGVGAMTNYMTLSSEGALTLAPATPVVASRTGLSSTYTYSPVTDDSTTTQVGATLSVNVTGSKNAFNLTGVSGLAQYSATGRILGTMAGINGFAAINNGAAAGTMPLLMGGQYTIQNNDADTIVTAARSINILAPVNAGTMTDTAGIYIASQLAGTQTNNPYAIYAAGSSDYNYFAGRIGVAVTTPTALLHVAASTTARASLNITAGTAPTTGLAVGDIWNDGALSFYNADATTNTIVNHLRLRRNSTGTAAAGFGLGIIAELESSTTDAQSAGRLTWEWATATHASRAAKGKLTAYYTSTEREAITWVADSAGVKVGINQPSPTALLHLSDSSTSGTQVLFVNSDTGGKSYLMLSSGSGNEGGAGKYQIVENASGNRLTYDGVNNRLGIGTTTPQSLIHMHDGSGGFLFVNQATVGGTLVTVIPDATGDVTEKIFFVGWCTNSAPFSADVAPTTLAVSSSTTKTDGTNTLTIAVTAGGAFTLQATGGAATWNVNLWVFWR